MANEGREPSLPLYVNLTNAGDVPASIITAILPTARATPADSGEELGAATGVEKLLVTRTVATPKKFFGAIFAATRYAGVRIDLNGVSLKGIIDLGGTLPLGVGVAFLIPAGGTVNVYATNLSDRGQADLFATLLMEV